VHQAVMEQKAALILPPSEEGIARAANALRAGEVVAFGTETVYGLGAVAGIQRAVDRVFALKRRPPQNPLICHVDGLEMAKTIARVDERAEAVISHFWPGPLTIVMPFIEGAGVVESARAGLPTVAVRAPAQDTARRLLTATGSPVVAPSANRSGRLSPTTPLMVAEAFGGELELILSGGKCEIGLESTVLDLSGPEPMILRPGAITAEDLEDILPGIGQFEGSDDRAPKSPGLLLKHYAPSLPVRINVRDKELAADEALLGFGPNPFQPKGGLARINLSPSGDLDEAARNLFTMLRELEDSGARRIAVAPIPAIGIGIAINDRLGRAAAATAGEG